jgi:hypothetical protein
VTEKEVKTQGDGGAEEDGKGKKERVVLQVRGTLC